MDKLRPKESSKGAEEIVLTQIKQDFITPANAIFDYVDTEDDILELMLPLERVEMEIVILRFGLYKDKPMSLEKVAKRLGKSREWTRKRLNKALEKMKVNS